MRYLILLICAVAVFLTACSGKDKITVDTTPPTKPIMVPHLGDLGDDAYLLNGQNFTPDDDNNGIDTVPDGDWFRISWEHLLDTDLDYIKIYRYDEFDPIPALVDSIPYNNDYYLDSGSDLSINRRYSYFIEAVDESNNKTISDTVSYKLLSKQIQTYPGNGTYTDSLNFSMCWQKSGFVSKFRVLLFDSDHLLLWKTNIVVSFEGNFFKVKVPNNLLQGYTGGVVYWRVDAFDFDSELGIDIGSESLERAVYLPTKK